MRSLRFLWAARPLQGLLEIWLLGLAILFLLWVQVDSADPAVLANGLLFLCGACGTWAVLRARLPQGPWWRQALWEMGLGGALSLVMVLGVQLLGRLLGWEAVWLRSTLGQPAVTTLLLLATGPGYVVSRLGVRLLFLWNRLRRQRMLWAIAHAHLTLVVALIILTALVFFLLSPYASRGTPGPADPAGPLALVTERLLHTLLPGMAAVSVMTGLVLLVLLPPLALFSFLIARRTTRRLEDLVLATGALRQGQYGTRVDVVGEDEVAQLQADFNAMAADLEQAVGDLQQERDRVAALLQSQRELVASVSHELRTPVTTVRGYLESGRRNWVDRLPEGLALDLEVVENEIVRLQGLIDDLFTLARAEAGGLQLMIRPIDVGALIARRVEPAASLAWQSGRVEVIADVPARLPLALADEARLEQVLINLLRNAIQHTLPGAIVAVVATAEDATVSIEVRDTGEGIPAEELPRIWERFYRGPAARQGGQGGAGLGLALVRDLTEAMGGQVKVESQLGSGSCFTVRLPRA